MLPPGALVESRMAAIKSQQDAGDAVLALAIGVANCVPVAAFAGDHGRYLEDRMGLTRAAGAVAPAQISRYIKTILEQRRDVKYKIDQFEYIIQVTAR